MKPAGTSRKPTALAQWWARQWPRWLPFADAASASLPLPRLLRLALFQVSVGMATALLVGTLNRVMIVELGMSAALVALMVALPLVAAPFRAFIGFRSDHHRSALGWKRVPYLWLGSLMLFGGLAIMPFALLLLGEGGLKGQTFGAVGGALAFLLVGAGMQMTQTAGLALATDLAPPAQGPRVVALLYTMLLLGLIASGLVFSLLLADFTPLRLIQVVQGAAALALLLNLVALWKQEPRRPRSREDAAPAFRTGWREFLARGRARRFLWGVGLGTAAFNMQDIILEPYGGEVLGLSVGQTSLLTALMALGALAAFGLSARLLGRGLNPLSLAAWGTVLGLPAFALVILAAPLGAPGLFRLGTALIGAGGGFFAVGTLSAAMDLGRANLRETGLALGAWGAVQATVAGASIAFGGVLRDLLSGLALQGQLGTVLNQASVGYGAIYHLELLLLFATLVAIGPLVRAARVAAPADLSSPGADRAPDPQAGFGLARLPG